MPTTHVLYLKIMFEYINESINIINSMNMTTGCTQRHRLCKLCSVWVDMDIQLKSCKICLYFEALNNFC